MKRLGMILAAVALASSATSIGAASAQPKSPFGGWQQSVIDADQNFRGLAAVSATQAWVSGESLSDGAAKVFKTTDAGASWQDVSPADTTGLSFRDVEISDGAVQVLAIGPGQASRIYRTTDGGSTWSIAFQNADEAAFYDCMAFYPDGVHGLAMSDPVDGRFRIAATHNAGKTWSVLPNTGMPDATGEAGFAASGDCLTTVGNTAYLLSGGAKARVFRSTDRGLTWTATDSGLAAGDAAGNFSAAFATPRRGIIVGGDFANPSVNTNAVSTTRDGRTWRAGIGLTHIPEDVAYVGGSPKVALASGNYGGSVGTSLTVDGGATWQRVSDLGYHALDCVNGVCWGAGAKGQVGRAG